MRLQIIQLMKGKNYPTTFLPQNTKIDGPFKCVKDKENICLTAYKARYIDKMVEQKGIVNVDTIRQEIEEDRLNENDINNEEEINPYCNIFINEFDRKM